MTRSTLIVLTPLLVSVLIASSCSSPTTAGPPTATVAVTPPTAFLLQGETRSFTATITGVTDTSLTWSASGGSVDGEGDTVQFTAPHEAGEFTVTATSTVDSSASGSATISVAAVDITLDPPRARVLVGGTHELSAEVTGTVDTGVSWSASCGSIIGTGPSVTYAAPTETAVCEVSAASATNPDAIATAVITIADVVVDLTPTSAVLFDGRHAQFDATVEGAVDPSVTWEATGGVLTGSGSTVTYTAGDTAGSYQVTATSVEDPTASATAMIDIEVVTVALEPTRATLYAGETQPFSASVEGTSDTGVTWFASCGSLAGTGPRVTFTAPTQVGSCTVTAASSADRRKTAVAQVETLGPEPAVISVTLDQDDVDLVVGESRQLTVTVVSQGGASEDVAWASSDPSVATVTSSGLLHAVGEGTTTITATSTFDPSTSDALTARVAFAPFGEPVQQLSLGAPTQPFARDFVAIDGDVALTSRVRRTDGTPTTGYVSIYRQLIGGGWIDSATVYAPFDDRDAYQQFGLALAVRGATAAWVTRYRVSTDPIAYEARVHVYERTGTDQWEERATLLANQGIGTPVGSNPDVSLALGPGLLAVGLSPGLGGQGRVQIYAEDFAGDDAWGLAHEILEPASTSVDGTGLFGVDVDVSHDGRLLAVGAAEQSDDSGTGSEVIIFERAGPEADQWALRDRIAGAELPSQQSVYVEIDGDVLAATHLPHWGERNVEVRFYVRGVGGPDNWGLVQSRTVPVPIADDVLMENAHASIALKGATALVGTTGLHCWTVEANVPCPSGVVHVLRRHEAGTDAWGVSEVLEAPDAYDSQMFGAAVDISADGRSVMVGSNPRVEAAPSSAGEGYIFTR